MKTYRVSVTGGARRDLTDIHRYLQQEESPQAAEDWLGRLSALATSLASTPERGATPRELEGLGIREYREVLVGPYRVVYRVMDTTVFIVVVADGRRDMMRLLSRPPASPRRLPGPGAPRGSSHPTGGAGEGGCAMARDRSRAFTGPRRRASRP